MSDDFRREADKRGGVSASVAYYRGFHVWLEPDGSYFASDEFSFVVASEYKLVRLAIDGKLLERLEASTFH